MTKYATGNPVGSTDPRDLYDNAENLDSLVNGDQAAYNDRLGKSRRSWQSVEDQVNQQEVEFNSDQSRRESEFQAAQYDREGVFNAYLVSAGYQFAGDYTAGIEITQYNQVVRDASGEFWRVSGSTELPYTTTGAGLPEGGAFVAVGDAVLRQELAASGEGSGSALIGNMPFITPEQFGVDGSASATDFAAWQAFWDYHRTSGIPGKATGRLYLFDPEANGVLRIGLNDGEAVDFDANGATFRFVGNMSADPGKFWHCFLFASGGIYSDDGATVERIHFKNAVLDGNRRNQPVPANPSDVEQRAHVKVFMNVDTGNRVKDVYFYNITQVDPIADTLQFGPSSAGDVNGEASINNLTIDKFHAGARNGVRAAIQIGSQSGRINISNVTKDKAPGGETNSIETEFSTIGVQKVELNLSNVHIDDIELGCPPGNEDRFNIKMTNVVAEGFFVCIGGNVSATNCTLPITITNTQRIKKFKCKNVTFRHSVYNDGTDQDLITLAYTPISGGCLWQFSDCEHVIDGTLDATASRPLFRTANISASEADDHVFMFDGVVYDPQAPISVYCYAGGTVKTSRCTFGGSLYGVQCGGFSSYGSKWHSSNDDFTKVTGYKFRIAGPLNSEIVFGSQVTDDFNFTVGSAGGPDIIKSSARKIESSVAPTFGGAVGDEVVLTASAYDSAASGDPVSWKCIRSSETSAVWAVTLSKP